MDLVGTGDYNQLVNLGLNWRVVMGVRDLTWDCLAMMDSDFVWQLVHWQTVLFGDKVEADLDSEEHRLPWQNRVRNQDYRRQPKKNLLYTIFRNFNFKYFDKRTLFFPSRNCCCSLCHSIFVGHGPPDVLTGGIFVEGQLVAEGTCD